MESKNLVICDPETKFASAFAQYLTRQKELAVRVRTCSDLSYVLAIQEKEKIDFLFISSEYPEDSRKALIMNYGSSVNIGSSTDGKKERWRWKTRRCRSTNTSREIKSWRK